MLVVFLGRTVRDQSIVDESARGSALQGSFTSSTTGLLWPRDEILETSGFHLCVRQTYFPRIQCCQLVSFFKRMYGESASRYNNYMFTVHTAQYLSDVSCSMQPRTMVECPRSRTSTTALAEAATVTLSWRLHGACERRSRFVAEKSISQSTPVEPHFPGCVHLFLSPTPDRPVDSHVYFNCPNQIRRQ